MTEQTGAKSPEAPRIPQQSEFPPGTEFVVKGFDVPLAHLPNYGQFSWINWYGGTPKQYDPKWLTVDNNWPAESFEAWVALIADSIHP